ncbi:MAG: hypothetical protein KA149_00350 [Chitinophagales bacterium]|nr:hypothetical protein [Chitinophagales bacterium]
MKNLLQILFIVSCFLANISCLFAQVPQKFNYQAVARNGAGTVLSNQNINARFSLRDQTSTGSILYQETQSFTTNEFGLFTHQVGAGSVMQGMFTGINWSNGSKFLQVEIDPAGGSNFISLGASELVSVPYALHAGNSASINGTVNYLAKFNPNGASLGNSSIYENGTDVGIGTTSPQANLHISTNNASGTGAYIENTVVGNGASLGFLINSGGAVPVGGVGYSSINNEFGIVSSNRDVALRASSGYVKIDNGSGNVGVNTTTPNSTLQVSGSLAVGVGSASSIGTSIGTGTLLTGTASFILLNPVNPNSYFRLPAASTCTGRMYVLYNVGANAAILERTGTDSFISATGSVGTVVAMPFNAVGKMAHLISDGTNWIVGFYN